MTSASGRGRGSPCPRVSLPFGGPCPASAVGGFAAIYGGASWEAGSWKAATLVAAGSMRKLKLQAAASGASRAKFRCAHLNLCIAFFFFLCYNESIK